MHVLKTPRSNIELQTCLSFNEFVGHLLTEEVVVIPFRKGVVLAKIEQITCLKKVVRIDLRIISSSGELVCCLHPRLLCVECETLL